jgi:negative regulator of flagellin synthesis FlgM
MTRIHLDAVLFVEEAKNVKISVEEVSRLLAVAPSERNARPSGRVAVASREETLSGREAAHVEVSASAQEVQQIRRLVNDLPDVREDRVRALKAQIESGTYNVSGEDIADLMIRRTLADNSLL